MKKRTSNLSLSVIATGLVLVAFVVGMLSAGIWVLSDSRWRTHQTDAYSAGVAVYAALQNATLPSHGVILRPLDIADEVKAQNGEFRQISQVAPAARTTIIPILTDPENRQTSNALMLIILSPDIVYPLAGLQKRVGQTAAETTGEVFALLASYCSDPTALAQMGDASWVQIDASSVWNCAVAPYDLRLIAAIGAIVAMAVLITLGQNISAHFSNFATQLQNRNSLDGPTRYNTPGPKELQDIVASVNVHLERERTQLESRAAVLSSVSHDLGTPATRLRLRTALIADSELRGKLEADIDSMTGMIESVLTYTRVEMNAEQPRKISLRALVDSIVADYQDTGHSVISLPTKDIVFQGGRSVFMSRNGSTVMSGDRDVVAMARPISLERAICNLIDNALKYGRRAVVRLEADSGSATIKVDDDGSDKTAKEIDTLLAPFQRGDNTRAIAGYGLGLTIVSTIASVHGGSLSFEDTPKGLSAQLSIQRN